MKWTVHARAFYPTAGKELCRCSSHKSEGHALRKARFMASVFADLAKNADGPQPLAVEIRSPSGELRRTVWPETLTQ